MDTQPSTFSPAVPSHSGQKYRTSSSTPWVPLTRRVLRSNAASYPDCGLPESRRQCGSVSHLFSPLPWEEGKLTLVQDVTAEVRLLFGQALPYARYPIMPKGVPRPLFPAICFIIF